MRVKVQEKVLDDINKRVILKDPYVSEVFCIDPENDRILVADRDGKLKWIRKFADTAIGNVKLSH